MPFLAGWGEEEEETQALVPREYSGGSLRVGSWWECCLSRGLEPLCGWNDSGHKGGDSKAQRTGAHRRPSPASSHWI